MKIAVIGPGGIGCLFSTLLSEAGHEVWLIDRRPDRASLIAREGIFVERESGLTIARPGASAFPADVGRADLVILCVKAHETAGTAPSIRTLVGPETEILSMQNGLARLECIRDLVEDHRLFAGVTTHGVTALDLNRIRHAGAGTTMLGPLRGNYEDAERLARLLTGSGIAASAVMDTEGLLWSKLVINAAICPVSALSNLTNGEMAEDKRWRPLLEKAARESAAVAAAGKIKLAFDDPVAAVLEVCRNTSSNISSMLQDIRRGRQTEIEAINGAVVRTAICLGLSAPVNESLCRRVAELEKAVEKS